MTDTLAEKLEKIIDEFGADIMQYGPPKVDPEPPGPAYSFANDPDTGIFRVPDDEIRISVSVL